MDCLGRATRTLYLISALVTGLYLRSGRPTFSVMILHSCASPSAPSIVLFIMFLTESSKAFTSSDTVASCENLRISTDDDVLSGANTLDLAADALRLPDLPPWRDPVPPRIVGDELRAEVRFALGCSAPDGGSALRPTGRGRRRRSSCCRRP